VFSAHDRILFRDRELEAELVGRRAPLPAREAQAFVRRIEGLLAPGGSGLSGRLSSLQRRRVLGSVRRMISRFSG